MGTRTLAVSVYVTATLALIFNLYVQGATGATFVIQNQCPYTVWAAGIPVGGGQALRQGQSWSVDVPAGTSAGRFWGRTGCSFDASGKGSCSTGDCGGVLSCTLMGQPPTTLVEYTLSGSNNHDCGGVLSCTLSVQPPRMLVEYTVAPIRNNQDYYDISVIDGFNVPLSLTPSDASCTAPTCSSNVNTICPAELKVTDGCNSACVAFNTPQYCCTGDYVDNCSPTNYSKIFKDQCPQAYSYAKDDTSSTFTCASGANYKIVFCP